MQLLPRNVRIGDCPRWHVTGRAGYQDGYVRVLLCQVALQTGRLQGFRAHRTGRPVAVEGLHVGLHAVRTLEGGCTDPTARSTLVVPPATHQVFAQRRPLWIEGAAPAALMLCGVTDVAVRTPTHMRARRSLLAQPCEYGWRAGGQ